MWSPRGGQAGPPRQLAPQAVSSARSASSPIPATTPLVVYATPTEYATIAGALDKLDIVPLLPRTTDTGDVVSEIVLRRSANGAFDILKWRRVWPTADVAVR
jgi:hypothetical protein